MVTREKIIAGVSACLFSAAMTSIVIAAPLPDIGREGPKGDNMTFTPTTQDLATRRSRLMNQQPSPAVRDAVEQFKSADLTARFTFLRGHVDAFSARPRTSVPNYAWEYLQDGGYSTNPVAQPPAQTTESPKNAEGNSALSKERDSQNNIGNDGPNDGGQAGDDDIPTDTDSHEADEQWYAQDGEEMVIPILRQFLWNYRQVFELNAQWLGEDLPNLSLVSYGVGQHFRRAEFTQSVNGKPVLDGKTIILFDLNWNIVVISRQLMTAQKVDVSSGPYISGAQARSRAFTALDLSSANGYVLQATLGLDVIRSSLVWQVNVVDVSNSSEYTVSISGTSGRILNVSDNTARFSDAQVKRWNYPDGDMTDAERIDTTNVYTHDDNTLVHDFFYLVNDDRNDGGTGVCNDTPVDSNSTPNAYGTTTSAEYVRPTRRSDRDFTLWNPQASKGSFGESHVYYWARKYVQWQKQSLVDLGLLTLGNFNNYTKALIIANACDDGAGNYKSSFAVSTMEDKGENLGTIRLPERCRAGNGNCVANDYTDSKSGNLYTYEGDGGYHFPGVIHHELNHFLMIEYVDVPNSLDCTDFKEMRYFQEGGLGRVLPQMYWHNHYNVGFLPDTTDKLFRSDGTSGKVHDETDASTLNDLSNFACADGTDDPYSWGGVVVQPMWEIYHGQKIVGNVRTSMARPALDKGMIKSAYFAADLASGSTFMDRWELANRFMEFWELFSTAVPSTKSDWCDAWGHHGLDTFIDSDFCS